MTFQLITDSTADLDEKWAQEHALEILSMPVILNGEIRQTTGAGALTSDTLLEKMRKGAQASTSQIPTGVFQDVFTRYAKVGVDVLYLAFSSGLSGTYQTANIARDMVLEEFPEAKITLVDTLAAASGEGFLVEEVVTLKEAGRSLAEILSALTEMIPRLRSWFIVDDLKHLARGGRISKTAAAVGTLASIKPVLDVDEGGHLRTVERARGTKKAINKLVANSVEGHDAAYSKIIIAYSGDSTAADKIAADLAEEKAFERIVVRPLGPVISVHTGTGTIAIFTLGKSERH
ncbi:MAG: DegV family protein [Streptococcaceae bacterium]|jgi:DegV family protein with EDD domain|nr:DegV family protein [Streptococcaceae bacterium]